MKTVLLLISQGETREWMIAQLSASYQVICFDELPEDWDAEGPRDMAAVLADLEHCKQQGVALAEQWKDRSLFSDVPFLGLVHGLPREEDADCVKRGFFDVISLPCPQALLLRRIENAIRASDSIAFDEMERMLKQLPSNIFLKDTQCRYVFATQYWHHLNHADDPDWTIRGKTDLEIRKDKQNAQKAMEADLEILRTGKGTNYIIEEKEDGVDEYLELIKRPVYDKNGKISGIIALINDVTEQELLKLELEKRTQLDTLTELLNKRSTENHIRMMLDTSDKDWKYGALMMIDVDNFKHINDTLGHAAGDQVLAEIARIIRTNFRVMDVTGRIGGDEFMVFLRDIADTAAVCHSAERILAQVQSSFQELKGAVSLSIGVSLYPQHGATFEALYQAADKALYDVKKHGKGTYTIYAGDSAAPES